MRKMRLKKLLKPMKLTKSKHLLPYAFMLPATAMVLLFVLVPVVGTVWNSLFRDVSFVDREYIGLAHYRTLLRSPDFIRAVFFTVSFTLVAVLLQTVLGFIFALPLSQDIPGKGLLRTVILVPWAIPTIISAKMWKLMFEYTYGLLNVLLVSSGLSPEKINWFGTPLTAFLAIVIAEVWKTTPFMVIILLAGLQAIPRELYSQARVDGTPLIKRFFTITLPLIKPVLLVALIFRTIDSIRIFDLVFVLTGGGPGGATKTVSLMGYEYFSTDRFGMGSAVSICAFLLSFAFTLIYLKTANFKEQIT